MDKTFSKYIVEFRYLSNPAMVGQLGIDISQLIDIGYGHWQTDQNQGKLKSLDGDIEFFITYNKFGATFRKKENLAIVNLTIKKILELHPELVFVRSGVRVIQFSETLLDFKILRKDYVTNLVGRKWNSLKPTGSNLSDLALVLTFNNLGSKINLQTGPMKRSQAKQIFGKDLKLPKVGIFTDIDYFRVGKLINTKRLKQITEFIEDGLGNQEDMVSKLFSKVLKK